MPEEFRVALFRVEALVGDDGFALVEQLEGAPFVRAVGERLIRRPFGERETGKERLDVALLFAERVVLVDCTGARENGSATIGQNRVWKLLPMRTMSLLTAWPQLLFPHLLAMGLCWKKRWYSPS